jgi:sec-independent protein translocase protein TatA
MGAWGIGHWVVVLIVVLVLFGRGRVADVMGEFGKGLKSFKQGMADEDNKPVPPPPAQIPAPDASATVTTSETTKTGE